MSVIDLQRVTDIIREVGQSEILPRFRNLEAHQIREKGPGNLVTEADIEAERQLGRRLSELMPGSVVVGEEAVAADHTVLAALAGKDPVWILDPVDGTANFAHHRPVFGVIVALAMEGTTVAGWIHDPVADTTAAAAAGEGAWIGDRRLHVAEERDLSAMAGSLGYRKDPYVAAQVRRLVRNGSVAHDYLALAEGRLDFACYRRLMPWDHAAGVLLHSEAGGWNALLDGSPYHPAPAATGVLLAPGEASWLRLRDLIAAR